jgi:transcription termination factor Rho
LGSEDLHTSDTPQPLPFGAMERPRKPSKPTKPAPAAARAADSARAAPRVDAQRADVAPRIDRGAPRERVESHERGAPRETGAAREPRERREPRDAHEGRPPREGRGPRENRDAAESRGAREPRDAGREVRDAREMSAGRDARESSEPRDGGSQTPDRGGSNRSDAPADRPRTDAPPARANESAERDNRQRDDWRKPDKRRGSARRGGRRRRRGRNREGDPNAPRPNAPEASATAIADADPSTSATVDVQHARELASAEAGLDPAVAEPQRGRIDPAQRAAIDPSVRRRDERRPAEAHEPRIPLEGEGMLVKEMGGFGVLRQLDNQYLPSRNDIFVPQRLIQLHRLRDGSIVRGRIGRGQKHKYALNDVSMIDGKPPNESKDVPEFKTLTTIDPDFHYAVGDATGDVSMRILDIICPVGRGQRGLIVAPPRAGKTTILRQFAKGIEIGYPDVHLMVLLVDERPEEATEWRRCTKGQVFVSTADETAKTHIQLAETVWKRATRLVELGQDVVLLLDSITRLARAYNNQTGGSGRTMSGGLDSQAMQKPRQIFGSARNTESAGSLTILGTTLVETGSRMDQLIFEEFKGTGNMELVLSRKLADRRIFPAIDIEKSGTRKEEKLYSAKRMKYIGILRRVLLRMNFIEAMELLVTKLDDVETNDEFLKRFEVDPEA